MARRNNKTTAPELMQTPAPLLFANSRALVEMLAQEGRDVELVVLFAEFVGLGPL